MKAIDTSSTGYKANIYEKEQKKVLITKRADELAKAVKEVIACTSIDDLHISAPPFIIGGNEQCPRSATSSSLKQSLNKSPKIKIITSKRRTSQTRKKSHESSPRMIPLYAKGEILAIRNEDGGFYLCICPKNIYTVSKPFQIQWLDNCQKSDIYSYSHFDQLDLESVLYAGVKLEKIDDCFFQLPELQEKKINHRLEKLLRGEEDISSDSDENLDRSRRKQKKKGVRKRKADPADTNEGFLRPPLPPLMSKGNNLKPKKILKRDQTQVPRKQHKKQMKQGSIQFSPASSSSRDKINAETSVKSSGLLPAQNGDMIRNQDATMSHLDPAFDVRQTRCYLPRDKLGIRAVIFEDVDELNRLYRDRRRLPRLLCQTRSIDAPLTALHYALRVGNAEILTSLCQQLKRLGDFVVESQSESFSMLSSDFQVGDNFSSDDFYALDDSTDENRAFQRSDIFKHRKSVIDSSYSLATSLAKFACSIDIKPDFLQLLMDIYPTTNLVDMKKLLFKNIFCALELGHSMTVSCLIKASQKMQNSLLVSSPKPSKPGIPNFAELFENFYVGNTRAIENFKLRTVDNPAMKPKATSQQFVSLNPDFFNAVYDQNRSLLHYAVVDINTKSLESLINDSNIQEETTDGKTPVMIAAETGREENVDLLLSKANSINDQMAANMIDHTDEGGMSAAHYAAMNGHIKVIEILAKYKTDFDKVSVDSKSGRTPLMMAAAHGHLKTCTTLIEFGVSLEIRDDLQRTALVHASMNGHYPVVSRLLRKGANPDTTDSFQNSAMHYTSVYGWYHCTRLLLKSSACKDFFNRQELTPVGYALLAGHHPVSRLLVKKGADCNFCDNLGRTIVMRLLANEPLSWKLSDAIDQMLSFSTFDVNAQDEKGMGALHYMAAISLPNKKNRLIFEEQQAISLHIATSLLNRGAEVNAVDYKGRLPLYLALTNLNMKLIPLFTTRGSRIPQNVDSNSNNILHIIATHWSEENMADLIYDLKCSEAGTILKLSQRLNKEGFTPLLLFAKTIVEYFQENKFLHLASFEEDMKPDQISEIMDKRASHLLDALVTGAKCYVNAVVPSSQPSSSALYTGKTAAHILSKLSVDMKCTVLKSLLELKPALDVIDEQGASPLVEAIVSRNPQAVEMLLSAGARVDLFLNAPTHKYVNHPLITAVSLHRQENYNLLSSIRALLRVIPDIKLVPPDKLTGKTALMFAVEKINEIELANTLLESQAPLDDVDAKGRTPLHLAVNACDSTAFLFNLHSLLIEKGASLTATDAFGRIPLHYAFIKQDKGFCFKEQRWDPICLTAFLVSKMSREDVDAADELGRTPLHYAAYCGASLSCLHLIENGANIERCDSAGNSPLGFSVRYSRSGCATALIREGANVNVNFFNDYPLQATARDTRDESTLGRWRIKPETVLLSKAPTYSTMLEILLKRDWQGVTVLVLDKLKAGGMKYAAIIESAMRANKYESVFGLLHDEYDRNDLYKLNGLQQNLLHILAINEASDNEEYIRTANYLLAHDVPSNVADAHGCNPLHYAALTKNLQLITLFLERLPSSVIRDMIVFSDLRGRNAFTALFWNDAVIDDNRTVTILRLFLDRNVDKRTINRAYRFPASPADPTTSDSDSRDVVESYWDEKVETRMSHLLIRAIRSKAHKAIDLLLKYGVDVNINEEASMNQTPLMIAAQQNDEDVVRKLLSCNPPALLSSLDSDGRTVLHHLVKPMPYGYWENVKIFRILAENKVSLEHCDNHGRNALSYALEGGCGHMSAKLQTALNTNRTNWLLPPRMLPTVSDPLISNESPPNYAAAADIMREELKKEQVEEETKPEVFPDQLSELYDVGKIVFDQATKRFCDVILTSVLIQDGTSQHLFCRLQIIRVIGDKLFVVFVRRGKIGTLGQHCSHRFDTQASAAKEFAKIFKLNTGNEWSEVNNFTAQTGKYHLVTTELLRKKEYCPLEFNFKMSIESKLDKKVQAVYSDMIKVDSLSNATKFKFGLDPFSIPFGMLDRSVITNGKNILKNIRKLLMSIQELECNFENSSADRKSLQKKFEEVQRLSITYQLLMPFFDNYIFSRLVPLNKLFIITRHLSRIHRLLELEFANTLLLGAQHCVNTAKANPLDYIHLSIGCRMQAMEEDSEESQFLLKYLKNAGSNVRVNCIYRVSRPGEWEEMNSLGLRYHRFLCQGSNISKLMFTLRWGLQPSRFEDTGTNPVLGEGIYLSDMAEAAMKDCMVWGSEMKYMLMAQVAIGFVQTIKELEEVPDPKEYHAFRIPGRYVTKPGMDVAFPEGGLLSLGEKITNTESSGIVSMYNVYAIHNPKQVCMRYLVRFDLE